MANSPTSTAIVADHTDLTQGKPDFVSTVEDGVYAAVKVLKPVRKKSDADIRNRAQGASKRRAAR